MNNELKKPETAVPTGALLELHCHLDGSLTRKSIEKILGRPVSLSELQVEPDCRNLAEYLQKFDLPIQCLQTREGIREASREFLLDVAKENVRYMEVRFAPTCSINAHMTYRDVMEATLCGLEEARKECGTFYNVIVCCMRHFDLETNLAMLKGCREFLGEGVCAADLAGDEASWPMSRFGELFREARKLDYPYTIHAGECGSVQNIVDAIEAGASRIGHGVAMKGCLEVQKLCRDRHIGVETCPTSNLQTRAVTVLKDYPVREFLNNGILVSVNTDNRTVSGTTLTQELLALQNQGVIAEPETVILVENALEAAFADDAVKQELYKMLKSYSL